ncbi:MAG: porin [Burkholderiales bacterium]
MQKKLIALAIASLVSAPVFAQSQVTLYGTIDAGVRHQDNADTNGNANTTMDSSGTYNSNRFGFKGSEDLGNGMKANFDLEGGFMSGTGVGSISGGLFGRKAIVGLSGNWGALDLGRNYTSIFYTTGAYDPMHYKYTGIIPIAGLDGARRDNTITYTSVNMNGLTLRANIGLGEVAGSNSDDRNAELGASYANGPLSFGVAYGVDNGAPVAAKAAGFTSSVATGALVITPTAATAAVPALKSKQWTIGGAYKMNPFEVMIGYDIDKTDLAGGSTSDRKVAWIGGRYAMSGANAVSLAYYDDKRDAAVDGTKKLWILGFVHNLSKRTEFYADIDSAKVDGSLNTGTDSSNLGISIGINHAF